MEGRLLSACHEGPRKRQSDDMGGTLTRSASCSIDTAATQSELSATRHETSISRAETCNGRGLNTR